MQRMRTWSLLALITLTTQTMAEIKLSGLFGNDMVLQRDRAVKVWGWADPDETVAVQFANQQKSATTEENGFWSVTLDAMEASAEPRALIVQSPDGTQQIKIDNVVVGDVWLCSGQSNMEWEMRSTHNFKEAVDENLPLIRHFKIGHTTHDTPQDVVHGNWIPAINGAAAHFTAVGFYFGRDIHKAHNIPIGLIGSNWGGTKIEPWTTHDGFRMVPELQEINRGLTLRDPASQERKQAEIAYLNELEAWIPSARDAVEAAQPLPQKPNSRIPNWTSHQDPTRIYCAMIHPLRHFAIKGAIWYQGESNGGEGDSYRLKKHALVKGWRELWGYDFPFYYVQLANFKDAVDTPGAGDGWARLREAQLKALEIPHTGMACIIDIGEARDIHPRNKLDVGKRLARWARANDYGEKELVPSGPLFRDYTINGNAITLSFTHVGSGLMAGMKNGVEPTVEQPDAELKRFAIAGADKQWVWANAHIEGNQVVVSSPDVTEPVAVRYAFSMHPEGCNLYNKEGLPASPFRTDNW